MTRATSSVASRRRRKRICKKAKGYVGDRKNHLRLTSDAVMRALAFNYQHRKQQKRNFRALWIIRIGIGARISGLSYSRLIDGLRKAKCVINRKMLADMAITDPEGFKSIAGLAKQALAA